MRFSIIAETEAGRVSGEAWAAENPDHGGIAAIAELGRAAIPFADYTAQRLAYLLGLDDAGRRDWWKRWGTDQDPSNSFTRGFCIGVAAVSSARPAEPAPYVMAYMDDETACLFPQ